MTGKQNRGKHHRSTADTDPKLELQQAEAALEDVKHERTAAVERQTLIERLVAGWERVHQANHLAELFTNEYRRTR